MKTYYKYLLLVIISAVFILSPFKNTFAKVTCGNGAQPSCASCGSSVYYAHRLPGCTWPGGRTDPCIQLEYAGTCGAVACGGSCSNRYAQMVPSATTMKNFYDSYYTPVNPWWNDETVILKAGSKGRAVSSLSIILEGFGFIPPIAASDTGAIVIDDVYGSTLYRAVGDLQQALKIPVTGTFDPTTNQAFSNFYLDISSILIAPAIDTIKFAAVYPGGLTSFFNGAKFDKPALANSFTVTVPTFIMQDSTGKNFLWKNDKWNLTTTAFPTPKTTLVPSIKTPLSAFSTKLSGVVSNVSGSVTANTRVANGTPSTVFPNIANILNYLGFSPHEPMSTDRNFGPTSIAATKTLDSALGLTVNDTFDSVEADAIKDFNSKFSSAVNSLPSDVSNFYVTYGGNNSASRFDTERGVFTNPLPVTTLDPYSRLTEISPNPPIDPLLKPWHIFCCAFGQCRFKCGLGDGYWF